MIGRGSGGERELFRRSPRHAFLRIDTHLSEKGNKEEQDWCRVRRCFLRVLTGRWQHMLPLNSAKNRL